MEIGNSTKAWEEYKKRRQNAKGVISLANRKKQKECASNLMTLTTNYNFFFK